MELDEKKQAREHKFMVDVFMNKPLPKNDMIAPVYVKREFTVKQTRKKSNDSKLALTNTEHYQLFNSYKRRLILTDLDRGNSNSIAKSKANLSTTKDSQHLESVLVGFELLG